MEDAEVLEYFPSFITEETAVGFIFFMCVVMVIAIIIQIVIYRVLLKAYVKRILKKSDKWAKKYFLNDDRIKDDY